MANKLKSFVSSGMVVITLLIPEKVWGADDSFEIIERIYDNTVTYSPGTVNRYNEGATLSTQPCPPQKERAQARLIYPDQEFENILMLAVPGQDGRERIYNTTEWPYSIHAHLRTEFDGAEWRPGAGSGVMVGPHHLLTCGHNVYDRKKTLFFDKISVYPGLNGDYAPFNKIKVTKAYVFKGWIENNERSQQFDMALLLLDQPIGDYVGWSGLLSMGDADLSQETINITGYPADKGCKQMWSMAHGIKTVMPEQFDYIIDTYGGQSGSAVWVKKENNPMILGVHTLGGNVRNSGVRLSKEKFERIFEKISDTYILQTPSPIPHPIQQLSPGKVVAFWGDGIEEMTKHVKKLRNYNITYNGFLKNLATMKAYYTKKQEELDALDGWHDELDDLRVEYEMIAEALEARIDYIEHMIEMEDEEWGINKRDKRKDHSPEEEGANGLTDEPEELIKQLISEKREYMKRAIT